VDALLARGRARAEAEAMNVTFRIADAAVLWVLSPARSAALVPA
jgi:hypothetical protein